MAEKGNNTGTPIPQVRYRRAQFGSRTDQTPNERVPKESKQPKSQEKSTLGEVASWWIWMKEHHIPLLVFAVGVPMALLIISPVWRKAFMQFLWAQTTIIYAYYYALVDLTVCLGTFSLESFQMCDPPDNTREISLAVQDTKKHDLMLQWAHDIEKQVGPHPELAPSHYWSIFLMILAAISFPFLNEKVEIVVMKLKQKFLLRQDASALLVSAPWTLATAQILYLLLCVTGRFQS